jgi:hypothetical protein
MKTKINLVLAIGMLLLASLGCSFQSSENRFSFTSANISDLKFGTNKDARPAGETFSPRDKIYIVSEINNTASKHKVRVVLFYENVKGENPDSIAVDYGELDVPGEYSFYVWVFPKRGNLPIGRYRAEAVLLDEDGSQEIQRKEATFDVADDD